jgi:hypothetical protein
MERRGFLVMGAAAAAGLAVTTLSGPWGGRSQAPAPTRVDDLQAAHFDGLVGECFQFAYAGEPFPAVLRQVQRAPGIGQRAEAFALYFEAEGQIPAQGLFDLTHPALGTQQLFAVRVGASGRELEIIFS